MNRDHINTEIASLLETISEQHQHISESKGIIPLIELDIILSNIAKLYEQISNLKKINAQPAIEKSNAAILPEADIVAEITVPRQEPARTEINTEPLITREKNPIVSFVVRPSFVAQATAMSEEKKEIPNEAPEPVKTEMKNPVEPVVEVKEIKEEAVFEQETVVVEETKTGAGTKKMTVQSMGLFDSVTTVADQFAEQPTLRDKISKNQTDSSLGKKLQKKPVEDLKKSIGINERFSLINELFDGDLNNYNKAIDMLNQSAGLSEAMVIVREQLIPKYGWKENNKSYLDLADLLERRFMK